MYIYIYIHTYIHTYMHILLELALEDGWQAQEPGQLRVLGGRRTVSKTTITTVTTLVNNITDKS